MLPKNVPKVYLHNMCNFFRFFEKKSKSEQPAPTTIEDIKPVSTKCALLMGLSYENSDPSIPRLGATITDVHNMYDYLKSIGYEDIDVITDESEPLTKTRILSGLRDFVRKVNEKKVEVGMVYYSGHGTQLQTPVMLAPVSDEPDDECLVATDSFVLDDEISAILRKVQPRDGCRVVTIWDCCNSGTMSDLQFTYDESANCIFNENYRRNDAMIVSLSACKDEQIANEGFIDGKRGGFMTLSLFDVVKYDANKGALQVFGELKNKMSGMDQFPILCSSQPLTPDVKFL